MPDVHILHGQLLQTDLETDILALNMQDEHICQNEILEIDSNITPDRFLKIMKYCTKLHTLKLQSSVINVAKIEALAEGLQHCKNLQTLNLSGNSIGDVGAKALPEGLQHCNNHADTGSLME